MANHHAVLPAAALKGVRDWTPERVEMLKALNEEALSAGQIAKALGGVTRNAVLGKLYRLGCGLKSAGAINRAKPTRGPNKKAPNLRIMGNGSVADVPDSPRKPWVDPLALQARANAPAGEVRAFADQVGPKPCLWPIGNPGEPGYHSCGQPAVVGKPYCPSHQTRAVQPRKEADPVKALLRANRRYA